METSETIIKYRPLLLSIAYNMVGTSAEAEDLVQDTFLKWLKIDHEHIKNTKQYLVRSVKNTCLNYLKAIQKKQEVSLETISSFSEKLSTNVSIPNFDTDIELSIGFEVLLKKLPPAERAVYLFREVFDFDYTEITEIFEKKKNHCRQLLKRAKDRLHTEKLNFDLQTIECKKMYEQFITAYQQGEFNAFIEKLKEDIRKSIP